MKAKNRKKKEHKEKARAKVAKKRKIANGSR